MKAPNYAGTWALVTGASSGLGAEFARNLAHRGANVVLTARSSERLLDFAADLSRVNGVEARVIAADLATPEGVRAVLDGVDALGVSVEHVVNNAGFGAVGSLIKTDEETHRRMVRLNVEALTAISRHLLPHLVALGRGGLIHVASTAAYQPTPFMATYGATKAFVLSFSLALSEELRGSGVRALAVCPGPVPTNFQRTAGIEKAGLMKLTSVEAPAVVEAALAAYDSGKALCIPGAMNHLQTAASKLLPRVLLSRATRWAMQGLGRT